MNFRHKKSLGQHFLKDKNIVNKIVNSAMIDSNTLVIEIGPGEGVMSELIIPKSKFTILYEIDKRLKNSLDTKLSNYDNYKIIFNDFLLEDINKELVNYEFNSLYVVANLPYYITTAIVEKFLDCNIIPNKMVLMMQKEVACRYSAKPNTKDYGSLTVMLNYYYEIDKLFDVSRNSFIPEPNVDSTVICMKKKKELLYVKDIIFFKNLIKDCFRFKRKNIKNNLNKYNLKVVEKVLNKYGFDLSVRAEALCLDVFVDLANELV